MYTKEATIILEAIVREAPVLDQQMNIPVKVLSVRYIENTEISRQVESNHETAEIVHNSLINTQDINFFSVRVALPIFKHNKIRAYINEEGLSYEQPRTAYKIELLGYGENNEEEVRAVYGSIKVFYG